MPNAKQVRRRRTRAEQQAETRSALLRAARRVFARRGFQAASVEEVAEEAGFSHGAVYSNFAGKEDLFQAAYEDQLAARRDWLIAAVTDGDGDIAGRWEEAASEWVRGADRERFLLHIEFALRALREPHVRRAFAVRSGAWRLALADALRAAETEGTELTMEAERLAAVIRALGVGLALEQFGDRDATAGLYSEAVGLLMAGGRIAEGSA
jgi:AcrR family transcriptional regulator